MHAQSQPRPTRSLAAGSVWLDRRGLLQRSAVALAVPAGLVTAGSAARPAHAQSATPMPATPASPAESGYVTVGELELFYARYDGGDGTPLLLLHGGLLTSDLAFGGLIPQLTPGRSVITIDLEGHGHTALTERPLSFEQMADDVAALLGEIGVEQVDVFAYSLGGSVAWQLTIRHAELIQKLIIASSPIKSDGWAPEILGAMGSLNAEAAVAMEATPLYAAYAAVAPRPEDWPELVTRVGALNTASYDWSDDAATIAVPVLFIVGDADSVLPEHTVELFRLLGGGVVGDLAPLPDVQLAILPGTPHSGVLLRPDLLAPLISGFLAAPAPAGA